MHQVSLGAKSIVPPPYDSKKDGCCDVHVPKLWKPEKFHKMKLKKLKEIYEARTDKAGSGTYKEMRFLVGGLKKVLSILLQEKSAEKFPCEVITPHFDCV